MKTIYKLGAVVLMAVASVAQAASFTLPEYQKVTLDNGLTVYLMEQHEVPLISAVVTVKAGAVQDKNAGQAELTASALMLGAGDLDRAAFEQKLDFVGATMSASGGLEGSYISASFAAKDQQMVLSMLADAVLRPRFDMQEFTAYKERHLTGLKQAAESPRAVIGNYFNKLVYADHPYGNVVNGTVSSVSSIELAEIKAFYRTWYTPDNAAITIAGDFDSKQMAAQLRQLFSSWEGKAPDFALPAKVKAADAANVLLVNKGDARESTFLIGGKGIARSNPDYVALSVINTVLGARFTSWLNDELRVNAGLTYGARSRFDADQQDGTFAISTFTQTATTEAAIDLALKTYARLWEKGIDKDTLASAKAYVKGQFPPNYETASSLAYLMSNMFVYGFDESFINNFSQQVDALDTERAAKLIKQYFPKKNLQFVIVGKADDIRDIVSKYGKVTETEIDAPTIKF